MSDADRIVPLKQHGVFQDGGDMWANIIIKDVVTPVIQDFLLGAECIGQAQMNVFLDKRPCEHPDSDQHLDHQRIVRYVEGMA